MPAGTQSRTLTAAAIVPIPIPVSRPDGRSGDHRKVAGEESPGSMDERCRITSGGCQSPETVPQRTNRPPATAGKGEKVR